MSEQGWIGVDLDGTLAHYEGWNGGRIGMPVPEMVDRIKRWLDDGREVRIFTARASRWESTRKAVDLGLRDWDMFECKYKVPESLSTFWEQDLAHVDAWIVKHIGKSLPITSIKDPAMIELWDDRCVQVIPNTGKPVADRIQELEAIRLDLLTRLSRYEFVEMADGSQQKLFPIRMDPTVTPEDVAAANARLLDENKKLEAEATHQRENKNQAYRERNMLVAVLARIFPSGIANTAIEGWNPEWHSCVYIDGPFGQCSWHYHDSQAYLFDHLPPYKGTWDGHTTDDKYCRLIDWAKTENDQYQEIAKWSRIIDPPTPYPIPHNPDNTSEVPE